MKVWSQLNWDFQIGNETTFMKYLDRLGALLQGCKISAGLPPVQGANLVGSCRPLGFGCFKDASIHSTDTPMANSTVEVPRVMMTRSEKNFILVNPFLQLIKS
ncbi:unnamed protein product [Cuscuta epithymum]|uniref:Uncharacterized protein n=1 Tax=Cuscuta epithymum TaxID=186058 RepID=A0AAV0D5B0_9ASTE|nr:unnamed protein product [Cuscuta epithymum]